MIEFDSDVDHGDWKTALVRKNKWPTIPKGTKVKVVGYMQNFEGIHVTVEYKGSEYDVPRHQIVGLR